MARDLAPEAILRRFVIRAEIEHEPAQAHELQAVGDCGEDAAVRGFFNRCEDRWLGWVSWFRQG